MSAAQSNKTEKPPIAAHQATSTRRTAAQAKSQTRTKGRDATLPLLRYGDRQERAVGWQIVKEALAGGWRSVGPYGPRADLYDRP